MISKISFKLFLYLFLIIYFLIGLFIYKDFGIGIEEHFQRQNGFYWLNKLISYTNYDDFKYLVNSKYQQILLADPDLPDPEFFNFYGIIFDLPLAFIETFFDLKSSKFYFEIRHLFIFLIFFISSIYFLKILKNRFDNNSVIFLGLFFYIFSPRIFGDSFYNNKDILFLSILTISISYLFELFEKRNNKNLILFCFFAALATSTRIMGVFLPLMLFVFYFLEYLINKFSTRIFLLQSFKLFLLYIFFLYLHFPYIWELNIFNISGWFLNFFFWMDIKVLFNGDYYSIKYLPRSYLPLWIFISTPIIIVILFLIGSFNSLKQIFVRILSISETKINKKGDLWASLNEKKDLFISVSFFSFIFYAIFLNVPMLSGWRHFYFLHFFIIYLSSIGINFTFNNLRKYLSVKVINILLLILLLDLIYINYKFHPYQSLYFNNLLTKNYINKHHVDFPSISRSDALKFIVENEKNNNNKIYIANASWTPLYNGKDMLTDSEQKKLVFVGQDFDRSDYIYTNFIYKSDEKYNKYFKIPKNFIKIRDYKIKNVLIYSIFKKQN